MALNSDIARCNGVTKDGTLHKDCVDCLRRTELPSGKVYMQPEEFKQSCDYKIFEQSMYIPRDKLKKILYNRRK